MKSIIFTEEQLKNLNEIGQDLFNDSKDPRSTTYERKLNRPKISWLRISISILIPVIIITALVIFLRYFDFSMLATVLLAITVFVIYLALSMKRTVICLVKIYQRYAPDSTRNKCRFEPSCSEYMILAIEKYGLIKGVKMGINRLKRCNVDGGGFDYP